MGERSLQVVWKQPCGVSWVFGERFQCVCVSDIFNCARRCRKKKEIGEIYLGEKAFKG